MNLHSEVGYQLWCADDRIESQSFNLFWYPNRLRFLRTLPQALWNGRFHIPGPLSDNGISVVMDAIDR